MKSSELENNFFLKPKNKRIDIAWENPFVLKDIFKNCEIRYQGRIRHPEKLFSEHELSHINLVYAGILFRLQKIMQQSLPCQLVLLKEEQQVFTELSVEFVYGPKLDELHDFFQQELQTIRQRYSHFMIHPYFRWRHNPALEKKYLSFELQIKS